MTAASILRITSFDPGSSHLGAAVYDHDARHDVTRLVDTGSMDVADHERYPELDCYGRRGKRLHLMGLYVEQFCRLHNPDIVVIEDAYLSRFPAAFRSLVEGICAIRDAVLRWNQDAVIWMVEPSTAKAAFDAAYKGAGKDGARAGVYKYVGPLSDIDLTALNEHTIDAVGIGYWGVQEWRRQMQLPLQPNLLSTQYRLGRMVHQQPLLGLTSPRTKTTSRKRKRGRS